MKRLHFPLLFLFFLHFQATGYAQRIVQVDNEIKTGSDIRTGADQLAVYLPKLIGKSCAVVGNQSSLVQQTHLVDTLLARGISIKRVFCPEHGFRGLVDAGEKVKTEKDPKTGLEIISLYGKNKKPLPEQLKDVDVVIFDLQDVGVRFYTYLSTLHYVMEACAENKKQLLVLDRPNPNGFFIDGPVLEDKYKSFLGLDPVPLVYGMTIGEYARMLNGEGWLSNHEKCDLEVISLVGYTHNDLYQLPVKPSPNLPNMASVYLYPSLGLFEGTVISVGRGTDLPFQVIGHPQLKNATYSFTPQAKPGALSPKYKGIECKGINLSEFGNEYMKDLRQIYLFWLLATYKNAADPAHFFDENFNFHAGNASLQEQIKAGKTEEEIRASWQEDLKKFKLIRKKYLLYPDFS